MNFKVKNKKRNNVAMIARKIGYRCLRKRKNDKEAKFVKPLARGGYPRFHLFLKNDISDDELIFSLHIDQKKPVYKDAHAHAAEYDSKIVEQEANRITKKLEQ